MASITLNNMPFPEGATVGVYDALGYPSFPAGGPPGAIVTTDISSGGTVTFTGLLDKPYWAAAEVSGTWRYVAFVVAEPEGSASVRGIVEEVLAGQATELDEAKIKALIEELGGEAGLTEEEIQKLIEEADEGSLSEADIKALIEEIAGTAGLSEAEVKKLIEGLDVGLIEEKINAKVFSEAVHLQDPQFKLPATGDQREAIQAALDYASKPLTAARPGRVIGEPHNYSVRSKITREHGTIKECVAGLHVPGDVEFQGDEASYHGFQVIFTSSAFTTGDWLVDLGVSAYKGDGLSHMSIFTDVQIPLAYYHTGIPPTGVPMGILLDNNQMSDIQVNGKLLAGLDMIGDHGKVHDSVLGGWAGFTRGPASQQQSAGNNAVYGTSLIGTFCTMYCFPDGNFGGGDLFQDSHFGLSAVMFYVPELTGERNVGNLLYFEDCGLEGGQLGKFVNPDKRAIIEHWSFKDSGGNGSNFSAANASGGLPSDRVLLAKAQWQAAKITGLKISDDSLMVDGCGYGPEGCVFDVTALTDSELGDCTLAINQAKARNKPFMRGTTVRNVRGYRTGNSTQSSAVTTQQFRLMKAPAAVNEYDVLRQGTMTPGEVVSRFDGAGKPDAGTALMRAAAGDVIPVVRQETHSRAVNNLGKGTVNSAYTAPVSTPTGASTLAAAQKLASAAAMPFSVDEIALPQTEIRLSGKGDLPTTGGVFSLGGQIITYTSLVEDATSGYWIAKGCSGGTGTKGIVPIGFALKLASVTGFAAEGVAKLGASTYFSYRGINGVYLHGVNGPTGTFEVGETVTAVPCLKLQGRNDGYPATHGAVLIAHATGFYQATYAEVLLDRMTGEGSPFNSGFAVSWVADIQTNAGAGGSIGGGTRVVGGTRLNGELAKEATEATVYSTTGFPSSGTVLIGGVEVKYISKTSTKLKGLTGVSKAITNDSPVTPAIGKTVLADSWVRPRFAEGAEEEDDKALTATASGPYDSKGHVIGHAAAADDGAAVMVSHQIPA